MLAKVTEDLMMFGMQSRVSLSRDVFLKAVVVGALIVFAALAMMDDLFIFR